MGQRQRVRADMPCAGVDEALTRVLELFGKRWTGLIVAVLTHRAAYFAELRRAIPKISERMLSDRLAELADAGLVLREVDAGPPLRVSYRLTEAGQALRPALHELGRWAETYLADAGPCVQGPSCPEEGGGAAVVTAATVLRSRAAGGVADGAAGGAGAAGGGGAVADGEVGA